MRHLERGRRHAQPGNVILLNGNSSAGKSTIARVMQEELDEPFLHTGIDHFLERVPESLIGSPDSIVTRGWEVTFTNGKLARAPMITSLGYQIVNGIYAAIAAFCRTGNNAIVDDVIYDPTVLKLAVENFAGLDVFAVGLTCELAEAQRREISAEIAGPAGQRCFMI